MNKRTVVSVISSIVCFAIFLTLIVIEGKQTQILNIVLCLGILTLVVVQIIALLKGEN